LPIYKVYPYHFLLIFFSNRQLTFFNFIFDFIANKIKNLKAKTKAKTTAKAKANPLDFIFRFHLK